MKRQIFLSSLILIIALNMVAINMEPIRSTLPSGKAIYVPKELQNMDLQDPESQWSYHHMACTENLAFFWEKGFGNDLSNPPALDGQPMKVNLQNLEEKLERFYTFFQDSLQFLKPGSNAEKYRMNDHFNVYIYRAITHELGHFRGMTDLYANIIEAENNPVTHEKLIPPHCLMNDFCYTPDEESYWSDYAIRVINKAGNKKITDIVHTMMYDDFAQELSFIITQNGNPISANIKLYPATYSPKKWSNVLSEVPLHSYSTPAGKCTIEDLKKLFFDPQGGGFGRYQVFLAEISVRSEKKYQWLTDYMMHDCGLMGEKIYEIKIDF